MMKTLWLLIRYDNPYPVGTIFRDFSFYIFAPFIPHSRLKAFCDTYHQNLTTDKYGLNNLILFNWIRKSFIFDTLPLPIRFVPSDFSTLNYVKNERFTVTS